MKRIQDNLETAVLAIPLALIVMGFCVSIYGGYLLLTATTALELAKGMLLILGGICGGLLMGFVASMVVD